MVVGPSPASRQLVIARPVVVEQVVPEPNDVYISAAANSDVVFVGGSTYIWVTGPDGQRHRHFFGRGDRRREVFRRRENLRSVTTQRPAQPPTRYAGYEYGHQRQGMHQLQPTHTANTHGHDYPPQRHLPFNDQAHHPDQYRQSASRQNQSLREASANHSQLRRPEPDIPATKAETPRKS